MIRHTAAEALYANAFSNDKKGRKTGARKRKHAHALSDDFDNRSSIAALIKIACNASNSATLRATACDCLGERVASSPTLATFAARKLFAKHQTGAPPECVFDALLCIIRGTPRTAGNLFHDAVAALCEEHKGVRTAAEKRVIRALNRLRLPSPAVMALNAPFFLPGNVARNA